MEKEILSYRRYIPDYFKEDDGDVDGKGHKRFYSPNDG